MAGVNASAFSTKAMSTVISGKFIQHRPLMPPQTYRRMSFQMPSDRGVSTRAMAMDDSLHSGLDVALTDFIFGKMKATDVAHSIWQHVVREGDFVIDATCGNGHDTLALTKMVYEQSGKGMVYGMDVQQLALRNTSSLLDCMLSPQERKQVKLFPMCHSRMESLVPEGVSVRLVAFNLGYLPGGNKELITRSQTTVQALNAATKVLGSGGLISIMAYIGHPGGCRFVLNVPKEDLQSFERILFLIEQAHWFYEDNAMEQNPSLKSLSLREFTSLMFQSCAALSPYIAHIDDIYKDFTSYKVRVPVTGAIILDESYERCLLVKGWKAGASWSFPRGKKNKDEEDHTCAIREVLEETGFDVSKLLRVEDNIEVVIGQQRVRLYIIGGVKEDTVFAPQTKKEISEIAWHRVDELQPTTNETSSRGPNGMKCFMVGPFLGPLKAWIAAHYPPATAKREGSLKGASVWKVKTSSAANVSALGPASMSDNVPVSNITVTEPYQHATGILNEDFPGKSFRNFRFDSAFILQLLDGTLTSG